MAINYSIFFFSQAGFSLQIEMYRTGLHPEVDLGFIGRLVHILEMFLLIFKSLNSNFEINSMFLKNTRYWKADQTAGEATQNS